eukprot:463199-Pelagomonas_calceolata.AAC.3
MSLMATTGLPPIAHTAFAPLSSPIPFYLLSPLRRGLLGQQSAHVGIQLTVLVKVTPLRIFAKEAWTHVFILSLSLALESQSLLKWHHYVQHCRGMGRAATGRVRQRRRDTEEEAEGRASASAAPESNASAAADSDGDHANTSTDANAQRPPEGSSPARGSPFPCRFM